MPPAMRITAAVDDRSRISIKLSKRKYGKSYDVGKDSYGLHRNTFVAPQEGGAAVDRDNVPIESYDKERRVKSYIG